MEIRNAGAVAVAILGIGALASAPALAEQKHDSNTLHKLGNAIQYPVRKSTENLSIDVHRAMGHKSVESLTNENRNAVITPSGKKIVIYRPGQHPPAPQRIYAHRRHLRHSRAWYRHHHYRHVLRHGDVDR